MICLVQSAFELKIGDITMSAVMTEKKIIPYSIDILDLENESVHVILDKTVISIIAGALLRATVPDHQGGYRPHNASRSLGNKLAKIRHIMEGRELAADCLDIADEVYDFSGECLKGDDAAQKV